MFLIELKINLKVVADNEIEVSVYFGNTQLKLTQDSM